MNKDEALEDCKTHREVWREALLIEQSVSKEEDDVSYWSHELAVFDRVFKTLNSLAEPVVWKGCGECDCSFSCHEGVTECIRNVMQPAQKPVQKSVALADEVIGCFDAAICEGLQEALVETTDERLKDLVERRLMYALYAAQEAKEKK